MAIIYQGTHGLWVRSGGAWVLLDAASATAMLYDVLGYANNKAWRVYRRGDYHPISGITDWHHVLTTDKNGPGSIAPVSGTLSASSFAGLPDLRRTTLTWVEHGSGGGFDLEIWYQNFNDNSFSFTNTYGAGRNGTTGVLWSPAGHLGNSVQAHLTYVDSDGFRGPTTHSNTITL